MEQQREQEYRPTETLGQMQIAIEHLKETGTTKSFNELLRFLSLQHANPEAIAKLERTMKSGKHPKINYDSKTDRFKYRPIIPVHDEDSLKAYLQRRKNMIGVKVDDVKDGWPDCVPQLESMAGRGEILLVRNKPNKTVTSVQAVDFSSNANAEQSAARTARDMMPKVIWGSDKSLVNPPLPDDLRKQWMGIQLPASEETLRDRLLAAGLKPSTAPAQIQVATNASKKVRKQRKTNRGTLTNTNVPMRDYSHLRK